MCYNINEKPTESTQSYKFNGEHAMLSFKELTPEQQKTAIKTTRESQIYRYYVEQAVDAEIEEIAAEWENVPIETKVDFEPLKDGLPPKVSGVRMRSTVESFEEISCLFETSGIDINPDIIGKVSILFQDERVISIEIKGKRDNLSEKEIDAIYNLTRLWAIFLADNLWAEAEAIVKIRMSDDAVRGWILLRGGRFDAEGVFLNV